MDIIIALKESKQWILKGMYREGHPLLPFSNGGILSPCNKPQPKSFLDLFLCFVHLPFCLFVFDYVLVIVTLICSTLPEIFACPCSSFWKRSRNPPCYESFIGPGDN